MHGSTGEDRKSGRRCSAAGCVMPNLVELNGNAGLIRLMQVEETGQKSTVLTLYELTNGEATASQGLFSHVTKNSNEGTDQATEFYGMDADILHKSLSILVKRGRAQVFGAEDQRGVKFF